MSVIRISGNVIESMIDASREAYPLEACGILGGDGNGVTRFYSLTNADASGEHYTMLPEEQFAVVKELRTDGMVMSVIWHSHPETPARMSEEDMALAYTPGVAYVIVSLSDLSDPDIQAYRVSDGRSQQLKIERI